MLLTIVKESAFRRLTGGFGLAVTAALFVGLTVQLPANAHGLGDGLGIAAEASRASRAVLIRDDFFEPARLSIESGTTVTWKWDGNRLHDVTMVAGPRGVRKFRSATKTSGTYRHAFRTDGKYKIECTVHGFTMVVNVG